MGLNTVETTCSGMCMRPRQATSIHRSERHCGVHSRGAAGRTLRHPAPRALRLRRMGLRWPARVASARSQNGSAQQRPRVHRRGFTLASSSRPRAGPLQSGNGGPIIAVQVENEYGSFGADHAYMEQIHHLLLDAGFDRAMLYTADGADELENGSLPELPATINLAAAAQRVSSPSSQQAAQCAEDVRRVLGWLVRSLGRAAPHHKW